MTRLTLVRVVAGLLGLAAALLAVAFDDRRIAWVAIGCLAVSLAARLVQRRGRRSTPSD